MPLPFDDIDEEIAYILANWVQNNNQAITGTIGQNVVWNLAQFVKKNPENWNTAKVVVTNSNYTTDENDCIVIFTNNASGELDFTGNIWNKYYFVNATDNEREFFNGKSYIDINGDTVLSILPRTSVYIVKGDDDNWYEISSGNGGGATIFYHKLQFTVGGVDAPIVEGETTLVIDAINSMNDSCDIFLDSLLLYEDLDDQFSYTITYNPANITIVFNQGVSNEQKYRITYSTN